MKLLLSTLAIALGFSSTGAASDVFCGNAPTDIATPSYAAKIGGNDFTLVLEFQKAANSPYFYKIVGGLSRDVQDILSCNGQEPEGLVWDGSGRAVHETSNPPRFFTSSYRICEYDVRGTLVSTQVVCNYAVGD